MRFPGRLRIVLDLLAAHFGVKPIIDTEPLSRVNRSGVDLSALIVGD